MVILANRFFFFSSLYYLIIYLERKVERKRKKIILYHENYIFLRCEELGSENEKTVRMDQYR